MVGVLITLLFAVGAIGVGSFLVERWTSDLDPAESTGVQGLVGLGAIGLLTLFIGLLPSGLKWGLFVVIAISLLGFVRILSAFKQGKFKVAKPEGMNLLFVFAIGAAALFALVGVLAPSDTLDWDTLAYHLAVPKLWIQAGQIQYIPFIHHSNFPFTIENLYIWGLTWGEQSGAKAFSLAFFLLGAITIFGFARRTYSATAGWWSALVFATIPVVMWESGTGYIDVGHGLFGGLGILYAAGFAMEPEKRSRLWLSAILLGFAAGTKYTGLQTIGVVTLVLAVVHAGRRQLGEGLKTACLVGIVAMAVAGPWYVKSVVLTGNPVFPFFFEKLGGKNWDQRRADVYRNEQQKFGAGSEEQRHNPTEVGNAILGLAYQPGRYVNPREDLGLGTPLGAIGIVVIAAGLLWAVSGKLRAFESVILGAVAISMVMWFFLSQQSRYVVPLSVPLAVLAGGAVVRLTVGRLLAGAAVLQAAYSLALVYMQRFEPQSQVVLGKISAEDYMKQTTGFFVPSQVINKVAVEGKVALYDEVFGYLLDVPYMWANPPHSMVIPYDSLTDADSYVNALKKLGFTHVYINLSPLVKDKGFVTQWIAAMGLQAPAIPFSPNDRKTMMDNWQDRWEVLLAEAVAEHKLEPMPELQKGGILFKVL